MSIFKRKQTKKVTNTTKTEESKVREIRCDEVYVLTTEIISDYYDENDYGPQIVTFYYLGTKKEDSYYELFSGEKLIEEKDTHFYDLVSKKFNVPYITKVEEFKKYLKDKKKKTIKLRLLFDFITDMNVTEIIKNRN